MRASGCGSDLPGNGNLGARVTELRGRGVEKAVLFAEGLVVGVGVRLARLESVTGALVFSAAGGRERKRPTDAMSASVISGMVEQKNANARMKTKMAMAR